LRPLEIGKNRGRILSAREFFFMSVLIFLLPPPKFMSKLIFMKRNVPNEKEAEPVRRARADHVLHRGFRVGKLGIGLTGSYLGYQLQNLFLGGGRREERRKSFNNRTARKIRVELQSLKGPAMKLGQALSMQSHLLPEDVIKELANLQMRAPAMHPSLARAQFKASLGKFPEDVYRDFTPEPFAAASLGQVHRAVTKAGEQVAVKIQYPAIRSAIENDFKMIRSTAFLGRLTGHIPSSVITELEQGILRETDYLAEADSIDFFREQLKPLPYVTIPVVFRQLSTDRVLTMSRLEGEPLTDFLARKPTYEVRNLVGARLMALFIYQFHTVNAIHADPHPGNYLVAANGAIGLVDFGCVKKFSPRIIELNQCFRDHVWTRGEEQARRILMLGCGPEILKRPRVARRLLKDAIELYMMVSPAKSGARNVVDFSDGNVLKKCAEIGNRNFRDKLAYPEFVFSSRAEFGLYNVLHLLGAKIDITAVEAELNSLAAPEPGKLS
jgi:predicted unusual protein kinase regulating ubiquinone biosynthesis (AarF/ABC1/UbiB family)